MAGPSLNHAKVATMPELVKMLAKGEETEVQYAPISLTASGDAVVVSAVTGKRIYVLGFWCTTGTDTSLQWKSGTTPISGLFSLKAGGGVGVDNGFGLMVANLSENLVLNSSAVATVGGTITYVVA